MDPVETLRSAAIRERLGRTVGSDQLIKAALDAVMAGVDSPASSELAGLGRREEPEARGLFDRVIDELELAPTLPTDPTAARWALVRWWCQLIVGGELAPGARRATDLVPRLERAGLPRCSSRSSAG